jgi:protein-S-isoprenylcysteine O-methyltransferase Ste14
MMIGWFVTGIGIVVWLTPFATVGWNLAAPAKMDKRARLGMLLEVAALGLMLVSPISEVKIWSWRVGMSIALFGIATWVAHLATRTLGKRHLRLDAAVVEGHELIQHGPYRVVRHPIYLSFLCAVWAVGILAAPWWLFATATVIFLMGTEIRVRAEDRLLAERFGEVFETYRRSTRAYLPLVR